MDGSADAAQVRLAVVEVLDRDGHARQVVSVWRWPVTIGRAIECDVVLDDPFVAAHHATLEESDGVVGLHVGDNINGAQVAHRHLKGGSRANISAGDVVQLGATRLRVRRAADPIAPERELLREPGPGRIPLAVLVVALSAWNAAERWLATDPGGRTIDYLPVLIGPLLALAVWSGGWSLGSRLFRHRFDYRRHARIAASYWLLSAATAVALPLLAYATGWVFPSRIAGIAAAGVLWAMVLAHLTLILPTRRRVLALGMGALFVAGIALFLTRNYQVTGRVFGELYVSTLAPPALRVASPVATARFIDEARRLKAGLDRHVKDDDTADPSGADDGGE
jgi:pSer/pThr/pTyr-binding forkhead associated (FHA) protein